VKGNKKIHGRGGDSSNIRIGNTNIHIQINMSVFT